MQYIIALGNPGSEYETTRHNMGWLVTDVFLREAQLPALFASGKYAGRVSEGVVGSESVAVLYPETFMNKSGSAAVKLVPKNEAAKLIVVYDDVDLALGEVKVSFGRGDGGHNGIKSLVDSLGTKEFVRLRVGISPVGIFTGKTKRPVGDKLQRYVMGHFTKRELAKVEEVGKRVAEILSVILKDGHTVAMNRFN
jgi:peptidyl-tRNA hydrolase, PTH1 family